VTARASAWPVATLRRARTASQAPLTAVLLCAVLLGCASTPAVDSQWTSPELAQVASAHPLRGARVLVACEAAESMVVQWCQERLTAELGALGATAVVFPSTPGGTARDDGRYLQPARDAGASAIWVATVAPELRDDRAGPGITIGLGGFSGGRRGGVGVGVAVPVPTSPPAPVYAANVRLLETAGGRMLWTARTAAGDDGDAQDQIGEVMQRLVGAADRARLF
jgi:hypothetical protein